MLLSGVLLLYTLSARLHTIKTQLKGCDNLTMHDSRHGILDITVNTAFKELEHSARSQMQNKKVSLLFTRLSNQVKE